MKKIIKAQAGFTLIEMMIVVAIIAILTAVAIPKFNESLAMTNTARVQADLQSLDTAIAMYRVQNNGRKPASMQDLNDFIDIDKLEAPGGDVYINGTLTPNENNETYALAGDKNSATFMGKDRSEFGHKQTSN